ncbi:DUF6386 family protein [Brevibacillus laterosporus]
MKADGSMTEVLYFRVSVGNIFVGAADDVTGGGLISRKKNYGFRRKRY